MSTVLDEPYQPIYFIGIALPNELNRQIIELKWRFYHDDKAMLEPILPHVTLLHPPSLQGIMPSQLIPKVRHIAQRFTPLTMSIEDVGFFGDSVCYLKIQSLNLLSLQSHLVKQLPLEAQALHYKRDYQPHVTIAQIYQPKKLDKLRLHNAIKESIVIPQQFTVNDINCFLRVLPRRYEVVDIDDLA